MRTLTASKAETRAADPAAILAQTMALREYAGVPTLVLDTGALPEEPEQLGPHIVRLVGKRHTTPLFTSAAAGDPPHPDHHLMLTLNHAAEFITDKVKTEREKYRHVVPHALWVGHSATHCFADEAGPENYKPLSSAVVFAPDEDYEPHDLLRLSGIHAPRPAVAADYTAWRYWVTQHELAHVAGADEPQADMIATLFTRRAFPDDPCLHLMADIRAVDSIYDAVKQNMNPDNDYHRETIEKYGWPMVDAIDHVLAMEQDDIDSFSDEDILAHRFDRPDRDPARLMKLGEILAKVTGDIECHTTGPDGQPVVTQKRLPLMAQGNLSLIAQAASFMEDKTGHYTDDPAIHTMATRAAAAARRLDAFFDRPGLN